MFLPFAMYCLKQETKRQRKAFLESNTKTMTQYFIKRSDQVGGLFTLDQIKGGVKSNSVATTDLLATSKDGPGLDFWDFVYDHGIRNKK
jgi:hypothetical protein